MKKIYILKVLVQFFDNEAGYKRIKGEEFECFEKRALQILAYEKSKLVEILSIING